MWGQVSTKAWWKSPPAQECTQESLPHFTGGSRNRGYGRRRQALGYRPRSQSLELRLWPSIWSHCALKQWEKSSSFREKWHLPYLKIIPFRNIISSSEADSFLLYLSFLLSFFLAFLCFASTVSTERLSVIGQFHFSVTNPRDCGAKETYINCCVAGWQPGFPAA